MSTAPFKIAAAQFPVFAPRDWAEVEDTLAGWVAEAAAQGAQLLVFPEYAAMVLAHLLPPTRRGDLAAELEHASALAADWCRLHARLAQQHSVHLLAGSGPVTGIV